MNQSEQNSKNEPEFSRLKSIFWPIHRYELKKFLPMSLLMFCVLFVYTMVKDLKDVFILRYATCGSTELLPVLKLWFVMPAAFLFAMFFTFLISKFGSRKSFYIVVSVFISFYLIFVTILFPHARSGNWHASAETVKRMQESWPSVFYYVIPCLTNWAYTLFYCFSEIWGSATIGSLFWQFANQVTKKNEVNRFYGLYAMIANIGVILSGGILERMSRATQSAFDRNVRILVGLCIVFGIASMMVFYYINKVVLKDPRFYSPSIEHKEKKGKVNIVEGIKILFTSSYMGLVAVLILAYGITVNFVEIIWKDYLMSTLVNPNDCASMLGDLSMTTGILTIIMTFLSTSIMRNFKWKIPALIPPMCMTILGLIFFSLVIYNKQGASHIMGHSIPVAVLWVGLVTDAIIKSVKYCLFDPTKNMTFRPLDPDTKTKGQASVEVIAGRAGKAGASTVNYVLTNVVSAGSKISSHLLTIVPIFAAMAGGWIFAVFKLSKKYESKLAQQSKEI